MKRVKITERALTQRINRRLQQDGEKLCAARSNSAREQLGRFYIVGTGKHAQPKRAVSSGVVHTDVDLEKLAQKLGVIQPWEELEKGE